MKCLGNLSEISYSNDLVKKLSDLYTYKGKDIYFKNELSQVIKGIVKKTIGTDSIYASKILGLNIKESRLNQIAYGESKPRTKDEIILSNLKEIFTIIQKKGNEIEITANEFWALARRIFNDIKSVNYMQVTKMVKENILEYPKNDSRRTDMEEELKLFEKALNRYEAIQLITKFYVDIINEKMFDYENDFISLMIVYSLLKNQEFSALECSSFFEIIYNKMNDLRTYKQKASLNYNTGYARTDELNEFFVDVILECYKNVEITVSNNKFDKQVSLSKVNLVASGIMKLPDTFKKKDVKDMYPALSDSTIQRALDELKAEGKIQSNGTGRSATWTKISTNDSFAGGSGQLSINFDFE